VSGMAAVTELCDRLGVVEALDRAVGPIKQRDRGFGAGELLVGLATAQWAGEDFLVGLERQRADVVGQKIAPVAGLASTTAAGLARRVTGPQWRAVETGVALVSERVLDRLPAARRNRLCATATIDLDASDVEVYGRKKRGVAYNHEGQRVGRPHVASWAETETVLAAELLSGNDDPRAHAAQLLRRALAALPARVRAGRVRLRADAGYFAGELARVALFAGVEFAIGAKRIAPLWRLLSGITEDDWTDAIDMDHAQVAVADYRPDWWPSNTFLLIRRVRLDICQVSADPRGPGGAGPCTPTNERCRWPSWPTPTASMLTRSSSPISMCPHRNKQHRWSTGSGTAPASRTCSATANTAPLYATCRRAIPRSTPRGCGARCWPRPWPPGCTNSPPPKDPKDNCPAGASGTAKP